MSDITSDTMRCAEPFMGPAHRVEWQLGTLLDAATTDRSDWLDSVDERTGVPALRVVIKTGCTLIALADFYDAASVSRATVLIRTAIESHPGNERWYCDELASHIVRAATDWAVANPRPSRTFAAMFVPASAAGWNAAERGERARAGRESEADSSATEQAVR